MAKSKAAWADVRSKLARFDRAALLNVLQDLYAADDDNRAFLHARFGLGEDPLMAYKETIDRWLWPDAFQAHKTSVSKAKKAVFLYRYRNALGDPVGLTELLVFYCERAAGFCQEVDHRDDAYLDALVRAFKQALYAAGKLPGNMQNGFLARSIACDAWVVNSVRALERTWIFCFPSLIYQSTPGLIQGNSEV